MKKNVFGYIYKCTYLLNGKIYIGASTRLKQIDTYLGSSHHWKKEVDPYNHRDLIQKEILEYVYDREALLEREEYWIAYYNATNPDIGYNLARGGRHQFVVSEESKKIRDKHDSETMKRLMTTTDLPQRISKSMKEYRAKNGFSKEHKQRISNALKGKNIGCDGDTRSISVKCTIGKKEYLFYNKRQATKWYFENYPFSTIYSESTYRRAIDASINNKIFKYKGEYVKNKLIWSVLEPKNKENPVYCIYKGKKYHFDNKDLASQWWHKTYPLSNEPYNRLRYIFRITSSIQGQSISYKGRVFPEIKWFEERK